MFGGKQTLTSASIYFIVVHMYEKISLKKRRSMELYITPFESVCLTERALN